MSPDPLFHPCSGCSAQRGEPCRDAEGVYGANELGMPIRLSALNQYGRCHVREHLFRSCPSCTLHGPENCRVVSGDWLSYVSAAFNVEETILRFLVKNDLAGCAFKKYKDHSAFYFAEPWALAVAMDTNALVSSGHTKRLIRAVSRMNREGVRATYRLGGAPAVVALAHYHRSYKTLTRYAVAWKDHADRVLGPLPLVTGQINVSWSPSASRIFKL